MDLIELLAGGDFTLKTAAGKRHHVRIDVADGEPGKRLRFVNLVDPDGKEYYLGVVNRDGGGVRLTKASKFGGDDRVYQEIDRLFKAIHEGRFGEVEAAGYSFTKGRPDGWKPALTPTPPEKPAAPRSVLAPEKGRRPDIGRCVLFFYKIPTVRGKDIFPNPSGTLRRLGVRLDGSVWAVPESRVPWPLVNNMYACLGPNGERVTAHVADFDHKTSEKLVQIAEEYFAKELADVEARLLEKVQGYEDDYNQMIADAVGADKALTIFQKRVLGAVSAARKYRNDYEEAAKAFAVQDQFARQFATIGNVVTNLDNLARTRAASYADAIALARGTKLEKAAAEGDVPAPVLADYLEDEGKDVRGLREAFTNPEEYDLEEGE